MDGFPKLKDAAFPVVVSGPSGVGKTVLCRRLVQALPSTVLSVTTTTRPRRTGEREGVNYFFVTEEKFQEEIARGALAEWALVHKFHYGTPRSWLEAQLAEGRRVVLNIDVQGGLSIRRLYPEAVLVFILPPSWEVLEKRLRSRGTDSEEVIACRLDNARRELLIASKYDYLVVNDDLEEATTDLISIVRAECRRTARRLDPGAKE